MEPRCETCRFLSNKVNKASGLCRVNPPVLVAGEDDSEYPYGEWPRVGLADWCGKYEQKGGI